MPGRLRIAGILLAMGGTVSLVGVPRPLFAQLPPAIPEPELSSDVYLDEVGHAARSLLEQVKEFLANQQWDEAVETLRRVMENDGDDVIALPPSPYLAGRDFQRYVTVRDLAHMRLAEFHRSAPEALELYRQRVDPLARRLLEQALPPRESGQGGTGQQYSGQGNRERLERIIAQFFTSSYGDDALYHRGEWALERGDYLLARESWERMSPRLRAPELPAAATAPGSDRPLWLPGRPLWQAWRGIDLDAHWPLLAAALSDSPATMHWLAYPDTDFQLADIRARLVLVSILEGSLERAAWELDVLGRLHPEATGRIGGREGKYVERLGELLDAARQWPLPAPASDWPTFGGSPARWAAAPGPLDIRRRPIWEVDLPVRKLTDEYLGMHRQRVAEDARAPLSYHPVVQDGVAYVALGTEVEDLQAFDLRTGRRLWQGLPERSGAERGPRAESPRPVPRGFIPRIRRTTREVGVPRFTLTISGNRLLARVGSPITGGGRSAEFSADERSAIVGVDVEAERKLLFKIELARPEWEGNWAFEGPPLTDGASLYVALRRQDDVRAQLHVACFDLRGRKLRWRRMIAASDTLGHGQWNERTHVLLSLRDERLYVNTNLGAIASLRTGDGGIHWITRYERATFRPRDTDGDDRHFFRDLNPCLLYGNLVIAAPADSDRLFALDAATGQLIWATARQQATDVVHLLGVAEGKLIASGDFLYWIDVQTGRFLGRFPAPGNNGVRGFGRGQLAGDRIYWPTREAIYVLDQTGPRPLGQPIDLAVMGLTGGNLVIADGVLLLATGKRLVAFNETGERQAAATDSRARPSSFP